LSLEARSCRWLQGVRRIAAVQQSSQPRPGGPPPTILSSKLGALLQPSYPPSWGPSSKHPHSSKLGALSNHPAPPSWGASNHQGLMRTALFTSCHPEALIGIPRYPSPWDGYWEFPKSNLSDILVRNTPPGTSCQKTKKIVLISNKL